MISINNILQSADRWRICDIHKWKPFSDASTCRDLTMDLALDESPPVPLIVISQLAIQLNSIKRGYAKVACETRKGYDSLKTTFWILKWPLIAWKSYDETFCDIGVSLPVKKCSKFIGRPFISFLPSSSGSLLSPSPKDNDLQDLECRKAVILRCWSRTS